MMTENNQKIKDFTKKVAIFSCLFLGIFILVYYYKNYTFNIEIKKIVNDSSNNNSQVLGDEFSSQDYDKWVKNYKLYPKNKGTDADPDKDELSNYLEFLYGTNPLDKDSDKDGYTDKQEIVNGYDPYNVNDKNARINTTIQIEKIGVNAPMVWSNSEDERQVLKDLDNGLSHYYGTASPGQNGNMIISGHSSNYFWSKGKYNTIFKDLNNVEKGDIVAVKTVMSNGRVIEYKYVIKEKFITSPDDERIFEETSTPTITLSTCWPIGTKYKRVILKGEILQQNMAK